jgi:hypothetical protein
MWEEEFLETVKIQSSFMRVEQILVSEEKLDFIFRKGDSVFDDFMV